MTRPLTITLALLGSLVAGGAFAQSTTSDPTGIKVIDEPTITQQRGAVGQNTYSSIPKNERNYWNSGPLLDLNLDGQIDE
ncbi:MAG: hypothetical protein JWL86_660 [Rhizobium sp.]|nr:hypothetical protein [Rhizobium sp.]